MSQTNDTSLMFEDLHLGPFQLESTSGFLMVPFIAAKPCPGASGAEMSEDGILGTEAAGPVLP